MIADTTPARPSGTPPLRERSRLQNRCYSAIRVEPSPRPVVIIADPAKFRFPLNQYTGGAQSSRVHVLLVEDNADAAESLDNGYHVLTAPTGEEALASLGQFKPDVAILDIHLPGLDGCGVASLFRRSPVMKIVPIIAKQAGIPPGEIA